MLRTALVVLFSSVLAACASTASTTDVASARVAAENIDIDKIAAVNNAAQRSGVKVIWLRLPTKPGS